MSNRYLPTPLPPSPRRNAPVAREGRDPSRSSQHFSICLSSLPTDLPREDGALGLLGPLDTTSLAKAPPSLVPASHCSRGSVPLAPPELSQPRD